MAHKCDPPGDRPIGGDGDRTVESEALGGGFNSPISTPFSESKLPDDAIASAEWDLTRRSRRRPVAVPADTEPSPRWTNGRITDADSGSVSTCFSGRTCDYRRR
jgi:hypothetical protein